MFDFQSVFFQNVFSKCIFAKCTGLACKHRLSFASLSILLKIYVSMFFSVNSLQACFDKSVNFHFPSHIYFHYCHNWLLSLEHLRGSVRFRYLWVRTGFQQIWFVGFLHCVSYNLFVGGECRQCPVSIVIIIVIVVSVVVSIVIIVVIVIVETVSCQHCHHHHRRWFVVIDIWFTNCDFAISNS